jgi:hypothetical protein
VLPPARPPLRPPHLDIAARYLTVRETSGRNRSPDIDRWNRFARVPLGSNYCAAFISFVNNEARIRAPTLRTAWARAFIVQGRSVNARDVLLGKYRPPPGTILVWVRPGGGHVGYVEQWNKSSGTTIEANTSSGRGSQFNGDGVYRRTRTIQPFAKFRIVAFTPVSY